MPELSDAELIVLAWPTACQPAGSGPATQVDAQCHRRTEQLRQQIDWPVMRQEIDRLHQEIDRQQQHITCIRQQLPRGWYRRSSPTVDLEIRPIASPVVPSAELPRFWQLLEIWQLSGRKSIDPR